MKTNATSVKTLALTFLLYIVLTVTGAIVLTGVWQSGVDASAMTQQQLIVLAAQSEMIQVGSAVIGALAAVSCAAFVTCRTPGASIRPAVYFALLLMAYGVLSIVLHPEHTLMQQAAKLISPIPLCLIGAWIARQLFPAKPEELAQPG